jgi:hypothetical protein
MNRIVGLISKASTTRGGNNDDFADRLSSRYTVVLLVMFAVLVGMNQYVRNPISCWAPNHFTAPHSRYTKSYCWIRNTYYLPWSSQVPPVAGGWPMAKTKIPHAERQMIPYYQWIPFILLTQAFLFYAPTMIWCALNQKAGVDADSILSASHTLAKAKKEDTRERMLVVLTKYFDRFLGSRRDVRGKYRSCGLKCLLSAAMCKLCGRRLVKTE